MNETAVKGWLPVFLLLAVCMFSNHASAQNTIYVDFKSIQSGCDPLSVQFTPVLRYKDSSNKPVIGEYEWDFGDGSPKIQGENPVHIYHTLIGQIHSFYSVKLVVRTKVLDQYDTTKPAWIAVTAKPGPVIIANPFVTSIAEPLVRFKVDSILSKGISFHDTATSYYWTFGDINNPDNGGHSVLKSPEYSYNDTGKYKVKVTVISNGCEGSDSFTVIVGPQLRIFIPNVFRPIGKHGPKIAPNYFSASINENFQPIVEDFESFEMFIYNNQGDLYFHTTNPETGWHGETNGLKAMEGVYYYVIKVKNLQGNSFRYDGNFTLLR